MNKVLIASALAAATHAYSINGHMIGKLINPRSLSVEWLSWLAVLMLFSCKHCPELAFAVRLGCMEFGQRDAANSS